MKKIFWENPYETHLTTKVASVHGNEILLEETIAYSFSGGQESDTATINALPVLGSRMEGPLIYYTLPDEHGLFASDDVLMTIDWERRNRLMRLHFASELILEIVTQKFHLEKVGAHIAEHKSRIDFRCEHNISQHFEAILGEYHTIVESDKSIETGYMDIKTQRRYWKIEGFAEVLCGGTHVKSTREVGYVKLKRSHPGKSIERIEIILQDPSCDHYLK